MYLKSVTCPWYYVIMTSEVSVKFCVILSKIAFFWRFLAVFTKMRIFHWHPPDDPIPQGNQKMSRQEALEQWNSLKSHGWKRCSAPPR